MGKTSIMPPLCGYLSKPPIPLGTRVQVVALAVIVGSLLMTTAASGKRYGPDYPEHDIGVGPAIAYVTGSNYALNLDVSYSYSIFTSSLNFKALRLDDQVSFGPQLELTVWLLMNIGGGVGYMFGHDEAPIYHLFLGVPFGDDCLSKVFEPFETIYVEPYYRLNFFQGDRLHELGIMLKISTYAL